MQVICQFHDDDVCHAFPGFKKPVRENALNMNEWEMEVGSVGCDGIVALRFGPEGCLTLTLTMGTEAARMLAMQLIKRAQEEDAKLEDFAVD